jgi:hypothetical protein
MRKYNIVCTGADPICLETIPAGIGDNDSGNTPADNEQTAEK